MEWEILSSDGKDAVLRKTRTLRFLQSGVHVIREYVWGDEYSADKKPKLEDITVKPGEVVDIYREGGKYVVVISLDRPYRRNEKMDFYFERQIRNAFLGTSEWVELQPATNTREQIIVVKFPRSHPFVSARARFRYGDYSTLYDVGNEGFQAEKMNGRQVLTWQIKDPKARASYLIEWKW